MTCRRCWSRQSFRREADRVSGVGLSACQRLGPCLAKYEAGQRSEGGSAGGPGAASLSIEHWRGVTLPMGLLYERAAIEFWEGVAAGVTAEEAAVDRARAEDDGANIV